MTVSFGRALQRSSSQMPPGSRTLGPGVNRSIACQHASSEAPIVWLDRNDFLQYTRELQDGAHHTRDEITDAWPTEQG